VGTARRQVDRRNVCQVGHDRGHEHHRSSFRVNNFDRWNTRIRKEVEDMVALGFYSVAGL
jgi:hypothetical protein